MKSSRINRVSAASGLVRLTPVSYTHLDVYKRQVSTEEQTLNGILAHGTTEWYSSYIQPLVGQNTPVFFSEVNSDGFATMPFESYIYLSLIHI